MAAAQTSKTAEEVWSSSQVAEEDKEKLKEENWSKSIRASCPECNAPLDDNKSKFCQECGTRAQ